MSTPKTAHPVSFRLKHWWLAFALLLSCAPSHADTNIRIVSDGQKPYLFLVNVSTHHADLHNGYSRSRFRGILASDESHHIDTGIYLTLLHYSAWVYHPDFFTSSARTEGRLDRMPDIEPRRWTALLAGLETLPINGAGPTYAQVVDHIQVYPAYYLPALDRAGVAPAENVLEHMEALLARSEKLAGVSGELSESERRTVLRLQQQATSSLSELRLQLSLDREQRIAVRSFEQLTAGPRHMIEALVAEPGLEKIPEYLSQQEPRPVSNPLPEEPSWHGEHVDVLFSYSNGTYYGFRSDKYPDPLPCYRGFVQFDGRHLAAGLDPDLVASVEASFCRYPNGDWRLENRWAN